MSDIAEAAWRAFGHAPKSTRTPGSVGVDMNRFRFDYDLTFAVMMMDADGGVYTRFGTRDAESETDRMSIAGLKQTMRAVLAEHRSRPKGPRQETEPTRSFTLDDIPAFATRKVGSKECAHCHFANNFRFAQLRAEGKFSLSLEGANVPLAAPLASSAAGTLSIQSAQIGPGPTCQACTASLRPRRPQGFRASGAT